MITINDTPLEYTSIVSEYPEKSVEKKILETMISSAATHSYASINQLKFELKLRREIINASNALLRSGMSFAIFRKSKCNPRYWVRMDDGGFALKQGVKPSDAVADIFSNGSKYATECATGALIVYYKALLETFPEDAYNRMFPNIYLMNWHRIEKEIREVGLMQTATDFLPGDRRYFDNPDVDPLTPQWQGENVFDMGNGLYYGHGIGKYKADVFIKILNGKRKKNADTSAYLMDLVGHPNFKRLSDLYDTASPGISAHFYSA